MEDHVGLSSNLTFLSNNFNKLTSWERTSGFPSGETNNQTLVLQSSWVLGFHYGLGHLDVIRNKHSVLVLLSFGNIVIFAEKFELLKSFREHVLHLYKRASIGLIHLF